MKPRFIIILEDIARDQWKADLVGGKFASQQKKKTVRRLAAMGFKQSDVRYKVAYKRAQNLI